MATTAQARASDHHHGMFALVCFVCLGGRQRVNRSSIEVLAAAVLALFECPLTSGCFVLRTVSPTS